MEEQLILENQRLIYSICNRYPYEEKEDLFQVGVTGLLKAYQNYDEKWNTKFTTYAYPYILGEIRKYVRENKGIKISREIHKLSLEIDRYQLLFYQQTERFATPEELAIHFQKSELEIFQAMNSKNALQSADTPIVEDGKEMNLYDVTPSPKKQDIDELLDLKEALLKLEEEERQLICNRYYKDMSQTELSHIMGMSQVQISRKEQKVLKKLNHMLH